MGFKDIEIIDFDKVELHNIPNQFYRVKDIGRYMGKASNNLFTPIFNDINDTFNHIKY